MYPFCTGIFPLRTFIMERVCYNKYGKNVRAMQIRTGIPAKGGGCNMAKLVTGKTLIVIAHRLSTVKDSDQIFVVNAGNVQAHGTHEELLTMCPLYRDMWNAHISVKDTVKEGE